ncbi:LrgB family protein [Nakamurella deserti]|uniref:LrgB family protein n=1 Tax=Nakamurella deserti TaxID=2164074 RepID=UPI00197C2DA9|nr:LrgB family protein [Nakamurella deserti]
MTGSPVFGTGLTVGVYAGALWLHRRCGRHPLLTPVMVTIVVVALVLQAIGVDYATYAASAAPVSMLLGPATVALALPLVRAGRGLQADWLPVLVSVAVGCLVGIGSVWVLASVLGADDPLVLALLPKSTTTPFAIGLAEAIGGPAPLAAVFAIASGVVGAVVGPSLLDLVRVRDPRARGLAIGVSAHGIGTARALQESTTTGGWSSAGMVLNALATTAVLPVLVHLMRG